MSTARRIALNPSDYMFWAHHRASERAGRGGHISFLILEADGRADPDRVRHAYMATLLAHPATLAALTISRLDGRPYWRPPARLPEAALQAGEQAFSYDDLRASPDWQQRLARLHQSRTVCHWDSDTGPHVRLEQYDLPGDRTRFCMRMPHFFMDAEGSLSFAAELQRFSEPGGRDESVAASLALAESVALSASTVAAALSPATAATAPVTSTTSAASALSTASIVTDSCPSATGLSGSPMLNDEPVDILAGIPSWRRPMLLRRLAKVRPTGGKLHVKPLLPGPYPEGPSEHRFVVRLWTADRLRRMRRNAGRWAPPGPWHHARYLAMCVIRALHRIHVERGVDTDAYLIPFPINVLGLRRPTGSLPPRPLQGNYLVAPTLCARRQTAADKLALGEDLLRQLAEYDKHQVYLGQWALMWLASFMRASMYQRIFRLPLGLTSLASGFSYYGPIPQRIRCIAGARITNLWGSTPMGMPPGWNPIFNKFEGRMNLVLSWPHPAIPDDLALRYADFIEEEVFDDG